MVYNNNMKTNCVMKYYTKKDGFMEEGEFVTDDISLALKHLKGCSKTYSKTKLTITITNEKGK